MMDFLIIHKYPLFVALYEMTCCTPWGSLGTYNVAVELNVCFEDM